MKVKWKQLRVSNLQNRPNKYQEIEHGHRLPNRLQGPPIEVHGGAPPGSQWEQGQQDDGHSDARDGSPQSAAHAESRNDVREERRARRHPERPGADEDGHPLTFFGSNADSCPGRSLGMK